MKVKTVLRLGVMLLAGIVIGGYLFSDTRPRSFLALHRCEETCLRPNELAGLLASVGVQQFPALIPSVMMETDKTVVIRHPSPQARIHYVLIPKKDIKNIAEVSEPDGEYLIDVFRVVRELVKENNLVEYKLITNGPGYQDVTYLHFHLTAR